MFPPAVFWFEPYGRLYSQRGCQLSAMDAWRELYSQDYINLVESSLSLQNGHLHSFVPLDYVHAPFKIIMNGFPHQKRKPKRLVNVKTQRRIEHGTNDVDQLARNAG